MYDFTLPSQNLLHSWSLNFFNVLGVQLSSKASICLPELFEEKVFFRIFGKRAVVNVVRASVLKLATLALELVKAETEFADHQLGCPRLKVEKLSYNPKFPVAIGHKEKKALCSHGDSKQGPICVLSEEVNVRKPICAEIDLNV